MNKIQGSKGCFSLDSKVLTSNGYVSIQSLSEGDVVTSFNSDGEFCASIIKEIHRYEDQRVGKYLCWGGAIVTVTPSHWALNQYNTFAPIGNLDIGQDALVDENGHLVHIDSVEFSQQDVIGIKLETNFTLVIDGIRFHNGALGSTAIQDLISGDKGGKGGGGAQRAPVEDPNTLRSRSIARIVDAVSEGEIVGLGAEPLKNVFLNDTPIQNEDGSFNFEGVSVIERTGTTVQDHIAGFPSSESEISVGVEVTNGNPITRTVNNSEADAIRVKVRVNGLVTTNTTTGDRQGTSVRVQVQVAPNGGAFTTLVDDTIEGKTTSTYERAYRVELPSGGHPWQVRMVRITPDSTTDTLINPTFFGSYTEITDAKIQYSDTAVYGVSINSELFSENIPSRGYLIEGVIINVPTNYDPVARLYSGIWDGTFKRAYTNNPAWVFYDLLTNERYGLGDKIATEFVDATVLYTIAQYCDVMVDDGLGGLEPRFALNAVINTQEQAYAVLNTVASAFRAMPYWGNGVVTLSQDSPQPVSKVVSSANVVNGEFNYAGSAKKARHSRIMVSYLDPTDGYRPSIVTIENNALIDRYGNRDLRVSAFGCTSIGQATRLGKWIIDTEEFETETVSYKAGFDHADVFPGDIISVNDPSYQGIRYGGRLKQNSLSEVVLDDSVEFLTTETYSISIVLATGVIHTSNIAVPINVTTSIVTLATPMPSDAVDGAMWSISAGSNNARLFRVMANTHTDTGAEFEITALFYDPTKYARVEEGLVVDPKSFTGLTIGPLRAPSTLTFIESLYRGVAGVLSSATISWDQPNDDRVTLYNAQVNSPSSGGFRDVYTGSDLSFDLQSTQEGIHEIRVQSIGALGQRSPYITRTFNFQGLTAPPSDVLNFNISINNGQANLTWDTPPDLDLSHYVIKQYPEATGATWGNSVIIANRISGNTNNITLPSRIGTYLIKAIDTSGVESINATIITSNIQSLINFNAVETLQEDSTFIGVKTNTVVSGGELRLASGSVLADWTILQNIASLAFGTGPIASSGMYEFSAPIDLGAVFDSRLSIDLLAGGVDLANVMTSWTTLAGVERLSGADPSQWSVVAQVRTTLVDPALNVWTDWEEVAIGEYNARAFQFRVLMSSLATSVTPSISRLRAIIDMPDRVEGDNDIICPSAGLTVVFDNGAFNAIPAVAVSGQSLSVGDQTVKTNVTTAGFDLQFVDSNGVGVQTNFDYIARGYGYQQ